MIVTVIVFGITLYHTKVLLLETFQDTLNKLLTGEPIVREDFLLATDAIGRSSYYLYAGIILFSIITSMIAAHITLGPTRQALSMQKRFVGSVAHELRTPLAILRTENEVALYDLEPGTPTYTLVQDTIEQIKSLTSILNNLLVFNRVDTLQSIRFESVSMATIIDKTVERLSPLAAKRKITLLQKITDVPEVRGNATALEQMMYNITKNAIIHSGVTGGVVELRLEKVSPQYVTVQLKDEGQGIEPRELVHIFEPFYRADTVESGSGLGLSIVYEIMKLHMGKIHVASMPHKGTTMSLQIPTWNQHTLVVPPEESELVSFDFDVRTS